MRRLVACLSSLAAILTGTAALACGGSFGSNITIDPHQDIIVAWKDGVETYAFQPTFCGTSTDFGLILPVPAQLSQNPAVTDQQAFTAAATLSEPYKHEVTEQDSVGCGSKGGGLNGAAMDTSPTVVASGRVGMLDWVQLKANTVASFTDWLTANGYPYGGISSEVFSYYVEKGWYFLAFRINQEAVSATVCRSLGPIAFSFPTTEPVVPSRMAAADTSGSGQNYVTWRIFGITHGDVQLTFASPNGYDHVLWYSGALADADVPSFGGMAASGDRLTRLTYSFYKSSESSDVALTLAPGKDYRGTQNVYVHDDSACSIRPHGRRSHHAILSVAALSLAGLVAWRRRRS